MQYFSSRTVSPSLFLIYILLSSILISSPGKPIILFIVSFSSSSLNTIISYLSGSDIAYASLFIRTLSPLLSLGDIELPIILAVSHIYITKNNANAITAITSIIHFNISSNTNFLSGIGSKYPIQTSVTSIYRYDYKAKKEQIQPYLFPNLQENYLTISLTLAALPTLSLK